MRRAATALLQGALAVLVTGTALHGQELTEICPGAEDGTGALWGAVSDPDAGMVLPGATVNASWNAGGQEQSAEVQVGLDGSYTMCYLPLGTELTVQPMFATMAGETVMITLSEIFTQQDMALSMTGGNSGGDDGDDRIWMCFSGGDSTINIQNSVLIRCDAQWQVLERCPKTEFGRITAQAVGAGTGMMREMLENLVASAKRLGANAVINLQAGQNSLMGEAVLIEVDPSTC